MLLTLVAWYGLPITVLRLVLRVFLFFEHDFLQDFVGLRLERLENKLIVHVHGSLRVRSIKSVGSSIQMVLPCKGVLRKVRLNVGAAAFIGLNKDSVIDLSMAHLACVRMLMGIVFLD